MGGWNGSRQRDGQKQDLPPHLTPPCPAVAHLVPPASLETQNKINLSDVYVLGGKGFFFCFVFWLFGVFLAALGHMKLPFQGSDLSHGHEQSCICGMLDP